jgi:two-component system, chemotaxis family, protein-glutamate methylesterase/glutaminase
MDFLPKRRIDAAVLGVSAGGFAALTRLFKLLNNGKFETLPNRFPIFVVAHRSRESDEFFADYLNRLGDVEVQEVQDKQPIEKGTVYIAPAGYHLLVEPDRHFALSVDPPVNFSVPSIDVLFESAAAVYGSHLLGVILTGANSDGARGLLKIKQSGGVAFVQDPKESEVDIMPKAALGLVPDARVGGLEDLAKGLLRYAK